jgi:predicted ATP-dependent serine protease
MFTVIPFIGKRQSQDRVSSASEIFHKKHKRTRKIVGFEFLGAVPKHFTILLYGVPGGGKSTFSLLFGNKISEHSRVLYATAEEARNSESLEEKIKVNDIDSEDLFIAEAKSASEVIAKGKKLFCRNVIIDSISMMRIGDRQMDEIKKAFSGIIIYIAHGTKLKSYKGKMTIEHLVDVSLKVEEGTVTAKKNRFAKKQKFVIFDEIEQVQQCQ